jgi:serine/threonine-protein kinase
MPITGLGFDDDGDDLALIRQAYAGALRRDPEERHEFLQQFCAARPDLVEFVEWLIETDETGRHTCPDAHLASDEELTSCFAMWKASSMWSPTASTRSVGERRIGNYIVRRELGRGGMGVVYLADDMRLSRRVALKAVGPGVAHTPALRDRLRNEARLAASLSHPGIATIYALEEIDGDLYIACEFVPGPQLRALIKSGPLPLEQVVDIGLQVARALVEAHTRGIIHRDIKPENVIKTPSGVVKILDFGLARTEDGSSVRLTQTGVIVGTPAYLSPEQVLTQPADYRSDIFALGVLLYELASGTNPFVGRNVTATLARIVDHEPRPLSELQPNSVPDLDRVIATCLRKDPAQRYRATQELVDDLERVRAVLAPHRIGSAAALLVTAPPAVSYYWLAVHQAVVSLAYLAVLVPVWFVRRWLEPPPSATIFLLIVLGTVAAGMSLRLHLLFTARMFPQRFLEQHSSTAVRTRVCDLLLAVALSAAALLIGAAHQEFAMLLFGISSALVVGAIVIEPATARASQLDPAGNR